MKGILRRRVMLLILIASVLTSASIAFAYPTIRFLSVPEKQQTYLLKQIYSINETYYKDVKLIQIHGKERWFQDGWFTTNRVIMIDKSGLDGFKGNLKHELTHNKCFSKQYKWDLRHNSKCFKDGLK